MAAVAGASPTLTRVSGGAERIAAQAVTTAFFDVLGVRPITGRRFVAADNRTRNVTVIGERFWREPFGRYFRDAIQLSAVFDLDLWRANRAGADEHFDAGRFC